jgi:hypothetical protein
MEGGVATNNSIKADIGYHLSMWGSASPCVCRNKGGRCGHSNSSGKFPLELWKNFVYNRAQNPMRHGETTKTAMLRTKRRPRHSVCLCHVCCVDSVMQTQGWTMYRSCYSGNN